MSLDLLFEMQFSGDGFARMPGYSKVVTSTLRPGQWDMFACLTIVDPSDALDGWHSPRDTSSGMIRRSTRFTGRFVSHDGDSFSSATLVIINKECVVDGLSESCLGRTASAAMCQTS